MIDEISGRMSDQGQALDSSQRIGETFARTGGISGKIIGISGTIAKTGVKTGETYSTTWRATEAPAIKHSYGQEKPAKTSVAAGFVLQRNLLAHRHDPSHPPFIDLDHIGPCGDRRERRNQYAAFRRDIVQAALKPLPRRIVFGS